ncbi:putative disease resistance RPP13-like protein 1 [Corylus avellana]|uniref:putative disease resistance RPP13-like protein 1 n=1 Tax=Corylus avellana TaxID=13451 RepID=UPI00286A322A|nr:putative disease resistance RPP13-like protein 1 [Corylus avellana]
MRIERRKIRPVHVRDIDKEVVLELLLSEKCSLGAGVSVIPILGMGILMLIVTKTILKLVTAESCDDNDLNFLQVKLKEKLNGKKYTVILDDLWNANYHDWTILLAPFLVGALGSRIVITTRNQEVSSTTGTIPAYHLQVLSNDACLSLFTQHALGACDFNAHTNLQDIGEEVVKRCKGLPLAAKTLGGLLRTKRDRNEWEDILKSKICDIPKDYEFEKEQLVLLWIAEGLVQAVEGDKQMEDLGSEYFQELLSRKRQCFELKELGSLLHLRGTLVISQLENALETRDERDAKLIKNPNLTAILFLEWSGNLDELQDRTCELGILDMLHPNKIENCKKCTSLPPVGQLPLLKQLFIEGMVSVKNVGHEFYGGSCSQSFESLETLSFKDMTEWENWSPIGEFPHLCELSIKNCPKLLGNLPNHLPLLKKFLVDECEQLMVSISSFLELCELQIEGTKGVVCRSKVDFSSLKSKFLSTISEFTCPIKGLILEGLTHVEDLAIENCEELMPLWSNDMGLLQPLPCLQVLKFYNCPKLVSLVAEEVKEQPQPGLPSTLKEIYISYCNGMESLPKQ